MTFLINIFLFLDIFIFQSFLVNLFHLLLFFLHFYKRVFISWLEFDIFSITLFDYFPFVFLHSKYFPDSLVLDIILYYTQQLFFFVFYTNNQSHDNFNFFFLFLHDLCHWYFAFYSFLYFSIFFLLLKSIWPKLANKDTFITISLWSDLKCYDHDNDNIISIVKRHSFSRKKSYSLGIRESNFANGNDIISKQWNCSVLYISWLIAYYALIVEYVSYVIRQSVDI